MNPIWRARLRRVRFALLGTVAAGVILLGVLAGLTHLAMPWLASHPQRVAQWLGERLGREVTIGRLDGAWAGGGPVLQLEDVLIAARDGQQPPLAIARAQLAFDLLAPLRRERTFSEFRIDGIDLHLVNEGGHWQLRGLDLGEGAQPKRPFSLGALGALELGNVRLRIDDEAHALQLDLALPVLRLINHGEWTRVLARVAPRANPQALLDLVADLDLGKVSGTVYVGSRAVDLAAALAALAPGGVRMTRGTGLAQLWLELDAGVLTAARARMDLRNTGFVAASAINAAPNIAIEPRAAIDHLAFAARWLRGDAGWTLDIANLVAGSNDAAAPGVLRVARAQGDVGAQWDAAGRNLPLEPLGALAMLAEPMEDGLRQWLYLAHPRGRFERAELHWRSAQDFDLSAALRGAEFDAAGHAPGIGALDVDILGDAQATLLHLPSQALRVSVPRVFRWPFEFSALEGDLVARRDEEGAWHLDTDRLGFDAPGYGGEVRGGVTLASGRKPFLDLYAATSHGEVAAAKAFWPVNVMPAAAVEWLDRGLVDGRIVDGRVAFRGDLADWPFHNHAGYFIARAEVDGTTLDYHPQWPRAQDVHAIAQFINDGMQVDAQAGKVMGNLVQSASATIADFGDVVLELDVKAAGNAASLLNFMRATPVGRRYADPLKDLVVEGKASGGFRLVLPVRDMDAMTLDGTAQLQARRLEQLRYDQHFSDVGGTVRFSQDSLAADDLAATFRQRPVKLWIDVGKAVADPAHVFEAKVAGVFPASAVFADMPALAPVVAHLQGESTWSALVAVAQATDGAAAVKLSIDSDLAGTAIDLPVPLAKQAPALWPLHIQMPLPYTGQLASVQLADRLAIAAQLPSDARAFALRLHFGAEPAPPPAQPGIVIDGSMPQLDAGAWLRFVFNGPSGASSIVHAVDVHADEVSFADRRFDGVRLRIDTLDQATRVRIDSAALAGQLDIPRSNAASGITAQFTRMHWPELPPGVPAASTLVDVAPGSLPPLHVSVDDFRLGTASFGTARFESRPDGGRMVVETMETRSPNVTMKASGEWTGTAATNQSHMDISLDALSLGGMMDALGYPGLIDGGRTHARIDASWPGPPSAFALADLDGSLDIDIAEGRIPDANPGAGRIFGLLSITEIPRRLSLDFSDFFRSGLGFNSIKGRFNLADGNAYTDGVHLDSPAAEIVLSGRTGLRAKDYDQRLLVEPRAGAALPVVGALAGGPVGAAAGLVVQGILNKPISRAVARQYIVTGSWEKPVFTPVSAQRARAPSRPGASKAKPNPPGPGAGKP